MLVICLEWWYMAFFFSTYIICQACESHTATLLICKRIWYIPFTSEDRDMGSYDFCDRGIVDGLMTPASKDWVYCKMQCFLGVTNISMDRIFLGETFFFFFLVRILHFPSGLPMHWDYPFVTAEVSRLVCVRFYAVFANSVNIIPIGNVCKDHLGCKVHVKNKEKQH